MLFVDLISWWYGAGWSWIARQALISRSYRILQFFSVTDLLKTLFAPFRQDAYDVSRAPVGVKLQALGGNIISRFFGFFIRTSLILIGLVTLIFNAVFSLAVILVWPLVPVAPIVAIIFAITGLGTHHV